VDERFEKSDFKNRKQTAFAKKALKDNRESIGFTVNEDGFYNNDPEEKLYEIYRGEGDKKFLVYTLSIFKISMAYDDEVLMSHIDIGLSIRPEQGKDNSLFDNGTFRTLALSASALIVIAFFAVLYLFILPKHMKDRVFGISNSDGDKRV